MGLGHAHCLKFPLKNRSGNAGERSEMNGIEPVIGSACLIWNPDPKPLKLITLILVFVQFVCISLESSWMAFFSKLYGLREVVLVIESHDEDDDVTKSVCVHEMFLCLPNGPTVGSPERFWYWGPDLFSVEPHHHHHHHNHHHGYPAHSHQDIIPPWTIWAVMIMVGICQ